MPTLYLLIGGNEGDRRQMISHATDLIRERIGSVVAVSNIYETAPWGTFAPGEEPQNFYNKALQVGTTLSPHEALDEALCIERVLGRRRGKMENGEWGTEKCQGAAANSQFYSSRPMDIDLIFYDSLVIDTPDLVLPHPRMHLRRFVLQPLCEIAPDFIHPFFNKTLSQLLEECPDTSSCLCCC